MRGSQSGEVRDRPVGVDFLCRHNDRLPVAMGVDRNIAFTMPGEKVHAGIGLWMQWQKGVSICGVWRRHGRIATFATPCLYAMDSTIRASLADEEVFR